MANESGSPNALRGLRAIAGTVSQAVKAAAETPANTMRSILDAWQQTAQQQSVQKVDETVAQQSEALRRTLSDAAEESRIAQAQNEIDAARALDNAALSAARRGDRGGIGQGQYEAIQAAALQNGAAIRTAQIRLAADTAREIEALRAKGEFDKADAMLELGQSYLRQLLQLEQWGANWEDQRQRHRTALEQWEKQYALSLANLTGELDGVPTRASRNDEQNQRADAASLLLRAGVIPDAQQLGALGMTAEQAQSYIQSLMLHGKL